MPHNRYFCHACQQEFEAQDTQSLQCGHCGSDFVERVTELTFTREERQQSRRQHSQQESGSRDSTPTNINNDADNNEETMDEMLFGPQGIFSTFIPIIVDVDGGRETEGNNADGNQSNITTNTINEDTQEHETRRESFGHNLVHNIIPRVLRRVLHRHNQPRDGQPDNTTTTDQQGTNTTEHDNPPHVSTFDFTSPSGRSRIAIFAGNPYKSHSCNYIVIIEHGLLIRPLLRTMLIALPLVNNQIDKHHSHLLKYFINYYKVNLGIM